MSGSFVFPRDLLARFDVTGPRYTSYPTAPEWREPFGEDLAIAQIAARQSKRAAAGLSLYVHVPFCHKLCWYCACNMTVTRRADRVERYLAAVEWEIERVASIIARGGGADRPVVQIHWGGGTPTYLAPEQLARLSRALTSRFVVAKSAEISLEVHPPVTTREQLATLASLGFRRVSMGIQDFDLDVQRAVNRIQPYEQTAALIEAARELGFTDVNVDLMYGLPRQTEQGFARTLELVGQLRPDRLALFNYAHVPWLKPHQKLIRIDQLPGRDDKIALLELAVSDLRARGYTYIGMDHFALPMSDLTIAQRDGSLRRNFMGYTTCADSDLYAFGVSSISDLDGVYLQNARELVDYHRAIDESTLPVQRGMVLSGDDRIRRDVIQSLACYGRIDKRAIERQHHVDFDRYFAGELARLAPLVDDGIVELDHGAVIATPRGQLVLRNVCMVFDAYLERSRGERRYSRTI